MLALCYDDSIEPIGQLVMSCAYLQQVLSSSRVGRTQSRRGPKVAGSSVQLETSGPWVKPCGGGPNRLYGGIFALSAHERRPTGRPPLSASQQFVRCLVCKASAVEQELRIYAVGGVTLPLS